MGKKLIIKGADFSANGILISPHPTTRLTLNYTAAKQVKFAEYNFEAGKTYSVVYNMTVTTNINASLASQSDTSHIVQGKILIPYGDNDGNVRDITYLNTTLNVTANNATYIGVFSENACTMTIDITEI